MTEKTLMCKYAKVTCINQGNCGTCPNEASIGKTCKDSLDMLAQKSIPQPESTIQKMLSDPAEDVWDKVGKPEEKKEVCVWQKTKDKFVPSCTNFYRPEFSEHGPEEQGYSFCPYCGRKIMVRG
jgi:hypothetical protein